MAPEPDLPNSLLEPTSAPEPSATPPSFALSPVALSLSPAVAPSHDRTVALSDLCTHAELSVLASSSKGNCSALVLGQAENRRLILIDAGLSPRRTTELLAQQGINLPVHAILLTHLDHDHFHQGWLNALPEGAHVHIHKRHRNRAHRAGILFNPTSVFESDFQIAPGVHVRPVLMSHDSLGAAAFRIDFAHTNRSLGYATDLGRATQALVDHLQGVDVLAIESNYCPNLQAYSGRPEFLRRRITNGSGHLSNEQAAEAVRAIGPREHVVLLHLSLECNRPELAAMHYNNCPCKVTIASWEKPTAWVPLTWPDAPPRPLTRPLLSTPPAKSKPAAPLYTAPSLWHGLAGS